MSPETDLQAVLYGLGILSPKEARAFDLLIQRNAEARATAEYWQKRLAPLHEAISSLGPPPHLWDSVETALRATEQLAQSRNRWRIATAGSTMAAIGVSALFAFQIFLPSQKLSAGMVSASQSESADSVFRKPSTDARWQERREIWTLGDDANPKFMGLANGPSDARSVNKADLAVIVEP